MVHWYWSSGRSTSSRVSDRRPGTWAARAARCSSSRVTICLKFSYSLDNNQSKLHVIKLDLPLGILDRRRVLSDRHQQLVMRKHRKLPMILIPPHTLESKWQPLGQREIHRLVKIQLAHNQYTPTNNQS